MRKRWMVILPLCGLVLFLLVTYHAFRQRGEFHRNHNDRYFYWSMIRLDTDPLNRYGRGRVPSPCASAEKDCMEWEPEIRYINPGFLVRFLILSALPSFLLESLIIHLMARLGVNELPVFLITTPIFICAWYCALGLAVDRWLFRRKHRKLAS
jgi:hypothetical protein